MISTLLEFLSEHKIILWGLLFLGISNFLQCTMFYTKVLKFWRSTLVFLMEEESIEDCPPFVKFLDRFLSSYWLRVFSTAYAVALIALSIIGLVLL